MSGEPFLSATLIVRDEEENLADCLASVDHVVDEIVVVDTGSNDRTREIAREHGALLVDTRWSDDFAAPRNLALDHASGAWILYIDADERLRRANGLRRALEDPHAVAALVAFQVQAGFTRYREYRLFRNLPGIRFRGRIHETVVPDILRYTTSEGKSVVEVPVEIDHLGYEGDRTAKHARDARLLELAVLEDPSRPYLWHALGCAQSGLGKPQLARFAWQRGLELVRQDSDASPIGLLLYSDVASERLRRGESAAELITEASHRYPHHPLSLWLRARQSALDNRHAEAIALLKRLIALDPDSYVDAAIGMDRRIFRESAYELLGTCELRLGDPESAARWLSLVDAGHPGDRRLRAKRLLAEARLEVAAQRSAI